MEADHASCAFDDETEWSLVPKIFEKICARLGVSDIDLFALRLNHKVEKYCNWKPDPGAVFIGSFLCDWYGQYVYAFPPFAVLPKVLQKFRLDRADGIVVMPYWPI